MAIKYAVASGNWSSTSTWNGGTLPTSSDDVYANLFTVTIDTSPTVLSISNGTATGVTTAGGSFVPTNGIILTCTASTNGVYGAANGAYCVVSSLTSPSSATINANISVLSSTGSSGGISNSSTGTLNIVGSVKYPAGSVYASATIIVNNPSSGTINITGDLAGHTTGSAGQLTVVQNTSTGTVNINGNVLNGSLYGTSIINSAGGTINITGTVTGCYNSGFASVSNSSTGVLSITGTLIGLTGAAAVNSSTGTFNHTGSVQSSTTYSAIGGGSATQVTILTGPFLTSTNGINPVIAVRWFWANSNVTPTYYQIRTANLATIRPLYTADSVGGNPATSNVRSGTVFGPSSELTGTMAVPPAGSVALGVPVDNTTGTAYITASDISNALASASAVTLNQQTSTLNTSGSIGERLKLASTVATTAQQLSDALSNE